MKPELIVTAMLDDVSISSLVGGRIAVTQLPQNTTFPALVITVISTLPEPSVDYRHEPRARSRVQINPIAATPAAVQAIHEAVRALLDFQHHVTAAGKTVVSSRLEMMGQLDKDNEAGVWTQPADYIVLWVE